ncbi:hypothetical protein GCK72_007079 [Caenorhabditis remanei]|uniref:RING-type domain-containing protein n=1 Tax=Caenorhabditis remanei TaxID=31234 RepID=A0A6A5HJ05_CAERE|nr:hypothetical protein GCK72_007079 [Caenorhabditis remanei]KAF1767121.1 hypothetical protein GCK72_007079 [Caenorhabditis remanei]
MIHLESLICYACQTEHTRNLFDEKERRAVVGTCGHSVCLTCSRADRNCPLCRKPDAFIHGTVNYEAMRQIEEFKTKAFEIFGKWWKTLETGIGVCSSCSSEEVLRICVTCQQAQNLKDVSLTNFFLCHKCADEKIERSKGGRTVHYCDKIEAKEWMRGAQNVQCYNCQQETDDPHVCTSCFHASTNNINVDTFSVCADCVIENHRGHETTKAAEDYSIRHNTVGIVEKLLMIKLRSLEEKIGMKCKLRQMRLDLSAREALYWASCHYPLYTEEDCPEPKLIGRPKICEGQVEDILVNVKKQYGKLEMVESTCPCVEIWNEIVRLNIFDIHRLPPHFLAMAQKPKSEEDLDGCPYDFETSRKYREQLLTIIEKGEVLTTPHEQIFVLDRN